MNDRLINSELDAIQEPITNAAPEVKADYRTGLQLEKAKLYLKSPRNINEDILKIVKHVIQ